ncbi:MAG: 4Fe-4S binding protein [Candidatus Riflebacteria bacterium]|nr:4Fe-4S binding protein [Candidatus Riflebacteria bacterium]
MYKITEDCMGCGSCLSICPQNAIKEGEPFIITSKCNNCGECEDVCPVEAIVKGSGQ